MSSNDEKTVSFPAEKKGKKESKNNKPQKFGKSLGWFFGIAVLLLICITFILPTTLFTSGSSDIVFGSYNGKDISLSYDSYHYYQLQNIADYYEEYYGGSIPSDAWVYIYYIAFQNAAVFEYITELADTAGIQAAEDAVSQMIVSTGYWNDANGIFDTERYQAATDAEKTSITNYARMMVPFQIVTNDIYDVRYSDAEADFIVSLSSQPRDFEYYMIDNDDYPTADAITYAKNNPEPFSVINLTLLSYETKADAEAAIARIESGEITAEDEALANSIDNYAEVSGFMGGVPRYHLENILSAYNEGAVEEVYATEVGAIAGPYITDAGYSFFRVDAAPNVPDFSDDTTIAAIKEYIDAYENAIMLASIGGIAQDVYQSALNDFDAAGEKYNLVKYSVKSAAENPGDSTLILSMNYSDYMGYLASACTADPTYSDKLYDLADGEVLPPVLTTNSTYIVVRAVDSTPASDYMLSSAKDLYKSSAGEFSLNDLETGVLFSDKFVDNFALTYYSNIEMSSTSL